MGPRQSPLGGKKDLAEEGDRDTLRFVCVTSLQINVGGGGGKNTAGAGTVSLNPLPSPTGLCGRGKGKRTFAVESVATQTTFLCTGKKKGEEEVRLRWCLLLEGKRGKERRPAKKDDRGLQRPRFVVLGWQPKKKRGGEEGCLAMAAPANKCSLVHCGAGEGGKGGVAKGPLLWWLPGSSSSSG